MIAAATTAPSLRVFVVAGEVSADEIGGRVIRRLRDISRQNVELYGIGGPRLEAEGLKSLFPYSDLSLVGIGEVIPYIPRTLLRMRQTARAIKRLRPSVALFIDTSGFSRGVARRLQGAAIPLVQLKAPQAWAYWPWRARQMKYFDRLLAILPFEPEFFARYGVHCEFIGYPPLEGGVAAGDGASFRKRHAIPQDAEVIALLPGSRRSAIAWSLQDYRSVVEILRSRRPEIRFVVPAIAPVQNQIREVIATWREAVDVIDGTEERFDAFAASDVALAPTGTATAELAIAGVPMVACYRASWLTKVFAERFITVRYGTIVNLVLDEPAIPELYQETCTPDSLAGALEVLLDNPGARQAQREAFTRAVAQLSASGQSPSERAARVLLEIAESVPNA